MKRQEEYETLCNLWEEMQTANNPKPIVARGCAIISEYMQRNETIPAEMWPYIEFFEHANNVLNTTNQ